MKKSIFILFVCYLVSCKDPEPLPCSDPTNPECPNFDECLVFTPVNAEFVMIDSLKTFGCTEVTNPGYYLSQPDTTVSGFLFLKAMTDNDTYAWSCDLVPKIDSQQGIWLDLPVILDTTEIHISLITTKLPPAGCSVEVRDTVTKSLVLIPYDYYGASWSFVIGKFRGSDTDLPFDSFDIEILPIFPTFKGIENFPRGCVDQYHEVSPYRHGLRLNSFSTVDCYTFCGVGTIQKDHMTLVINYRLVQNGLKVYKRWIGRKLE